MTRQEGFGCSFAKLATLAGVVIKGTKGIHQHSQHGDSIEENLSPRSVLEQRALSGLAIAIDLEKKERTPSSTQHHVVLGPYCCKKITHYGQEEHNVIRGGSLSRERLAHMTCKGGGRVSEGPIVGLRMVASLYAMFQSSSPDTRRLVYPQLGRSMSRDGMSVEYTQCPELEEQAYVLARKGATDQENVSSREMPVNMSCGLQPNDVEKAQTIACGREEGEYAHAEGNFTAGRSVEESIFYCINPSTSNTLRNATGGNTLGYTVEDFLEVCCFCKCHLRADKDIYIYRGDQAFCSPECRYQQIAINECMDLTM